MPCHPGRKWAGYGAQREDGELTSLLNRQGMRGSHGGPRRKHILSLKAWKEEMLLPAIQGGWGRNSITVKKEKQNTIHQTFPLPPNRDARSLRGGCVPDSLHLSQGEEVACPADVSLGLEATLDGGVCSPDNGWASWSCPTPHVHAHARTPMTSGGRSGEKLQLRL